MGNIQIKIINLHPEMKNKKTLISRINIREFIPFHTVFINNHQQYNFHF